MLGVDVGRKHHGAIHVQQDLFVDIQGQRVANATRRLLGRSLGQCIVILVCVTSNS